MNQAANQSAWTEQLRAVLPRPLGNACRVAGLRGNALVVACEDGGTATRLRFLAPDALAKLQALAHFRQLERLELRVSRHGAPVQPADPSTA